MPSFLCCPVCETLVPIENAVKEELFYIEKELRVIIKPRINKEGHLEESDELIDLDNNPNYYEVLKHGPDDDPCLLHFAETFEDLRVDFSENGEIKYVAKALEEEIGKKELKELFENYIVSQI